MNPFPNDQSQSNETPVSPDASSHRSPPDRGKSQSSSINLNVRFPDWLGKQIQFTAPLWAVALGLLVLALIALD